MPNHAIFLLELGINPLGHPAVDCQDLVLLGMLAASTLGTAAGRRGPREWMPMGNRVNSVDVANADAVELQKLQALESKLRDVEFKYGILLNRLRISDDNFYARSHDSAPLPQDAERYLRNDHPRLLE